MALFLDGIVIFIGVGGMNNDSAAFGTVFILILGVLYFLLAFFFIGWVFSVRQRLPDYAKTQVTMGLVGLFKKLTQALNEEYFKVNGVERQPAAD